MSRERYGSTTHGIDFLPAVGPKAEIVEIIEANYEGDADTESQYVNEAAAAQDILDHLRERYGIELP
jgi:hypothetical protein